MGKEKKAKFLKKDKATRLFEKSVKRVGRITIRDWANFGFSTGCQVQVTLTPKMASASIGSFAPALPLVPGEQKVAGSKKEKKGKKLSYYMRKKLGLVGKKGKKGKKHSKE